MNKNHLLTNIKIEDYKCFQNFTVDGLKKVNLISGKNNVGKTALMEACFINTVGSTIEKFTYVVANINAMRNTLEAVGKPLDINELKSDFERVDSIHTLSNLHDIAFKVMNKDGKKEYIFSIDENHISININDFSFILDEYTGSSFIDNFGLSNRDLKEVFIAVQEQDKEEDLYRFIKEFDSNIINFKVLGGEQAVCKVVDRDEYQDINEFGDGLKHYISIICSLYACKDGYLFIDEIDNGIHYTQLDKLWEIILKVSKEQNVQLFATTHSLEMIKSYERISKKLLDQEVIVKDDIAFIELGRDEGQIESIIYDFDGIVEQVSQNQEMRGW